MAKFDGAFNDIGRVDLTIKTALGNLVARNLGPSDVAIHATPGNGGNVMDITEGSTGQLLANKSYKVKNWGLTVSFLRNSLDYCKNTFLIQEILDGKIGIIGIDLKNRNFGNTAGSIASPEKYGESCESLTADCAFLVNIPGIEAGAGASGDFTISFKLSNADYISGTFIDYSKSYASNDFPTDKNIQAEGSEITVGQDGRYSGTQGIVYPTEESTEPTEPSEPEESVEE